MKRNVSVVRFKFRCNILISGKIIKEMPGSVANGTHCICAIERLCTRFNACASCTYCLMYNIFGSRSRLSSHHAWCVVWRTWVWFSLQRPTVLIDISLTCHGGRHGTIQGHFMWDLLCKMWRSHKFFFPEFFGFRLSLSFHQSSILIYLSITDAMWTSHLTA